DVFRKLIERARQGQPDLKPKGKWQTDQRLHTMAELKEFVDLVLGLCRHVLDADGIRYRGLEITGCWANVGFSGSGHRPHAHPNNYFSGVYYVSAPPGGNTINFFDPRPQAGVMVPPSEQVSPMVAQKMTLDVKAGSLIFFPSWLYHSVDDNRSAEERISVAFNAMFLPYVEEMSAPNWEGNLKVTGG
ncbi:MAG: TIGR02466 family protein, partial [Gammaproteobacteria bacterium]